MDELHASEVWRNWGIVVGGAIGLMLAVWRGFAVDRQSRASRTQANIARRAHTTEVFNEAVSHLDHQRLEIRLGAIYTLRQISDDFPEFKHYVFQLLTAYLKERTVDNDPNANLSVDVIEIVEFLRTELTE